MSVSMYLNLRCSTELQQGQADACVKSDISTNKISQFLVILDWVGYVWYYDWPLNRFKIFKVRVERHDINAFRHWFSG